MRSDKAELTIDVPGLEAARARLDAFVDAREPLSGLDLYLLVERATSLLDFHTRFRRGAKNRMASGLQQSYGDHNRLLLLGLDKLVASDLAWYRTRLESPDEVPDEALRECFAAVRSLGLTRTVCAALWLAAAMHDCGMLQDRGAGVDVEDGVEIARAVIDVLCPAELRPLASFVIRNHDYIKDVFHGEMPVGFVAAGLERLEPSLQATALAALGMVQVAGAASLGEGRLSRFRVEVFRRCFDGRALADGTVGARIARLLEPPQLDVSPTRARQCDAAMDDGSDTEAFRRFVERVPLHGWHRAAASSDGSMRHQLSLLRAVARRFDAEFADHDHVVLRPGVALATGSSGLAAPCTSAELRNGTRAMMIGDA